MSGAGNLNGNVLTANNPASTTITLGGLINGNGGITMGGAGTLSLTDTANTYTGTTTINSGTLSTNNFGNNSAVTFAGGTLVTTASASTSGTVTFSAGAIIQPNTGTLTFSGNITGGANSLTMQGAGTLSLTASSGNINYTGGTIITNGTLKTTSLGAANGAITFGGSGTSGVLATTATITNSGTITVNNNSNINLQPTAGTLTLNGNIGANGTNSLNLSAASNTVIVALNGTNTYTGGTNITLGTLKVIGAAVPSSGTITNTGGVLNLISGTTPNVVLNNQNIASFAGIFNAATGSSNSGSITVTGGLNIKGTFNGAGSIENQSGAVITLPGGANVQGTIYNDPGANVNVTGANTVASLQGASAAPSTSGTVNLGLTGDLTITTNFVNHGSLTTTISGANFGQLNSTSSAANSVVLDNSTIIVTSSGAMPGTYNIITGNGPGTISANNVTYSTPPSNGFFARWIAGLNSPTDSAIVVTYEVISPPNLPSSSFANSVLQALMGMPAFGNPGQNALINYLDQSTSSSNFEYNLNQMVPNINFSAGNFVTVNSLLSKVETRAAARRTRSNTSGIAYGQICDDVSLWIGSFGNVAKQNQSAEGLNTGFRLRSLGGLIGIDTRLYDGTVFGVAAAYSNTNVYEMSNTNYSTHTMSYYGLLYGSAYRGNFFVEWVVAGGANENHTYRPINIVGNNLAVDANFYGWQGGLKFNFGNFSDWLDTVRFSHLFSIQYSLLHQPAYQEYGSVAALRITPNMNQSLLTLGTELRFALPGTDPWCTGSREIRAAITYDAIQPQQTTFANFTVGSPSFSITNNSPSRVAFLVGADMAVTFFRKIQLELSYDFEWRKGFYDNIGAVKLRYLF